MPLARPWPGNDPERFQCWGAEAEAGRVAQPVVAVGRVLDPVPEAEEVRVLEPAVVRARSPVVGQP